MAADSPDPAPPAFVPVNPYALARNEALALQVKRFYAAVSVGVAEGGFAVLLDGRQARTPQRRPIVLPTRAAADLVAAEFAAEAEVMRPGDMAVLRLVNAVLDGVADAGDDVRAEVVRYAGSDLLFYRAGSPRELVALQAAAWDPVLDWARTRLGARFYLAEGVMHVAQPAEALAAVARTLDALLGTGPAQAFRLGALHVMTTLTGSALLALAVLSGDLPAAEAWAKAHVDEDFQIARWGRDAEAEARRAHREADMQAAANLVAALETPSGRGAG